MTYIPSSSDLRMLYQKSRIRYARLKLYDENLLFLGEIQGDVISGNITLDASSAVRRSCSLTINVRDDSYQIGEHKKIWINRILNVEVGERDNVNDQIVYYQSGVFVFNETSYTYDSTSHTLNLSCSDLMSLLNETRGSQLPSLSTQILYDDYDQDYWYYYYLSLGYTEVEAQSAAEERANQPPTTLNEIIESTLNQVSFIKERYIIEDIIDAETKDLATVPYDLTFSAGSTVYDVLAKIRDLYPDWEMFFDENGYFIYRKIPDYNYEPSLLSFDVLQPLVVSETLSRNFNDIYNCTIVWGAQIETDLFIDRDSCSGSDGIYTLTEPATMDIEEGTKFGFTAPANSVSGQQIKIIAADGTERITPYPIKILLNNAEFCDMPPGYMKQGESYVVKYMKKSDSNENYYYLYGQYQVHGEFEEHNIIVDNVALQDDLFVLSVDQSHYMKSQVSQKYETVIDGEKKEYSFIKDVYTLMNGVKLIFVPPINSVQGQKIKILTPNVDTEALTLLNESYQPILANELQAGIEYVFQMFNGIPVLQGISENNSDSVKLNKNVVDLSNPFSVEKVGRIIKTLSDGDYSGISTDELANQRAEYETNKTVHFNDLINLSVVLVPWIDVNCKIKYQSQNTRELHDYLITNATLSFTAGTMELSLSRLYNTFI